ncbi:MAG: TetR/AcrR family transcriptional regulator [Hyphomicrobiales bacterium]
MTFPTRRERQAQQTKRDIVQAARQLFVERGYQGTSIARIAEVAGVSVQTIYDSLGSKAAIVRELNALIDDEGNVRQIAASVFEADDPRTLIHRATAITASICSNCGDIVKATMSAAGIDAELAEVYAEGIRRHRMGIGRAVERLASMGALRRGLDPEGAGDIMAGLSEPRVAFAFVDGYGWSIERWHTWVTGALCTLLLEPGTTE